MLQSLAALAGVAAAGYLSICGWMYVKQRELMYFPQGTRLGVDMTDYTIARGDIVLRGWRLNAGRDKALIYFGGNAERVENMRETLAQWFPDRTIYLLSYRGFGASDGAPEEAALVADGLAIFDQVAREHPGQPIAVIGRSLGSGVASAVAGKRPVQRLALVTPFDSLSETAQAHYRWLPTRWLVRDRYDSVANLRGYFGPILVVRATADDVVPPANTTRLIHSLQTRPQGVDVVQLKGADHHNIALYPEYGQALKEFID
ncbi:MULTISPECIES: alpha/beta fold hydrolase [unclassified Lysobacter]|uniref:alpha/beta hydrolase n=1 Tax=unclassified Lysobacter TaxID=2635362 RepID=UPI001BEC20CE|nr:MULTISPECIES: alpha/beta fold hydrolase [unclassified Lysobacter]MBT2746695.1 alpha/beta fold hydrolase [Lysobacter sp. ISL-42]MBT2751744.1 alpha/beta fold hydrolase [Lysobacter sp. ISL-50]MBT2778096.1 alpha/beta fold hydrolase [Lysobacter sp. ISL-54]MBT2781737.1 alpha/beta fold hydrolase [Lysobacter sp. ISL-52]